MAKAGHLCISKKGMAPLLQVVTSYYSPEPVGGKKDVSLINQFDGKS